MLRPVPALVSRMMSLRSTLEKFRSRLNDQSSLAMNWVFQPTAVMLLSRLFRSLRTTPLMLSQTPATISPSSTV
ncbi:hypothetical protein D3C77_213940 [compost metagenome]